MFPFGLIVCLDLYCQSRLEPFANGSLECARRAACAAAAAACLLPVDGSLLPTEAEDGHKPVAGSASAQRSGSSALYTVQSANL